MLKYAVPLLHVTDSKKAEAFYCGKLGFTLNDALRPGEAADPCYMSISRDRVELHLSSFSGDGVGGGVANLIVDDLDALHHEFVSRNVTIDTPPVDQTWGSREMYVKDADRNSLRFQMWPK